MKKIFYEDRKVDLVDFGDLKIFMYTNDLSYRQLNPNQTNVNPLSIKQPIPIDASKFNMTVVNEFNLPFHLMEHYWENNLDFTYIDFGCQYGTSAFTAAHYIKYNKKNNKFICFDSGVAGNLVNYNIKINNLNDIVKFENLAVSSSSYPSMVFCEEGHSENNRIVNRINANETLSYLIDCITIDDYLDKNNINNNLIIKIDTQGADYEVFKGMKKTLENKYVTFVIEFTPWAVKNSIDPQNFLEILGSCSYIIDIQSFTLVKDSEYKDFVKKIDNSQSKWTDLLVIPSKLPNSLSLVNRLIEKSETKIT